MVLDWRLVFALGVLGAAAPEIVRLYELRTNPRKFKWTWAYPALSVPFLILGGVVAIILPATTYWGAFYAGITAPVIISTATKKAQAMGAPEAEALKGLEELLALEQAQAMKAPDTEAFKRLKEFLALDEAEVKPLKEMLRRVEGGESQPQEGFRAFIAALF